MLEGYYASGLGSKAVTSEEKQRLAVVQAALQIAEACVSASSANTNPTRVQDALDGVAKSIDKLADAIEAAISKEK
ncbi:hypothetical protein J3D56_000002 [Erwinia persicina]|uniref:hypothetical protein n=1 Tax=Erwinia persicina TaxID=55211 RepID=UPI0020A0C0B1|nr:hypothetical protein [Erwinia persicina]MCP1436566.1 hypothetical protein [Erwinia persicina]